MSFAFSLKYALGLIPSADQLDAKWDKLIKMRDDLNQMENSEELKEYENLKNLIESPAFQGNKREIESLHYSGSTEEKQIRKFKKLSGSPSIRNYQKVLGSGRLERLHEILEGSTLKRFVDLQREIDSKEFRNRRATQKKKEFVKSPDFAPFKEYNQLLRDGDIKFWLKFSKSDKYNKYLKTIESSDLKHLEELKILTTSVEFKNRLAYLKDKKRFQKREEYKHILAFNELDKSKFMADYRKLKKARELEFFKKWDIVFEENFDDKKLNTECWQPENWWGIQTLGTSFSQKDEKQGYNGVKNIELSYNTLSILAKKEKIEGKIWIPTLGLMPQQFDYSSGILNSASSFRMREGVVEAKVRFKKDATITSAFSLTSEKPFPQIDLFRSTKKGVGLGILEKRGGRTSKYRKVNGLNDSHYHIFRLESFNDLLVWKINGTQVYRTSTFLKEPLFFHLLTTLHGEVNEHNLPHRFEIDWIRCYSKKS